MITLKKYGKFIFITLILLNLLLFPSLIIADDHEKEYSDSKEHEIRKEQDDDDDEDEDDKLEENEEDEGNEVTGQTALWLLVVANLSIALSILMKGINRYFSLESDTINSISKINRLQKKYLMRFHYVLNPPALCIAVFHFLLSSCRKSILPEMGLILMGLFVILGLMLKFKVSPKKIQRVVYRLHTSHAAFSAVILILTVGHLIVD